MDQSPLVDLVINLYPPPCPVSCVPSVKLSYYLAPYCKKSSLFTLLPFFAFQWSTMHLIVRSLVYLPYFSFSPSSDPRCTESCEILTLGSYSKKENYETNAVKVSYPFLNLIIGPTDFGGWSYRLTHVRPSVRPSVCPDFFSITGHRIFLIFCMKFDIDKG